MEDAQNLQSIEMLYNSQSLHQPS